MGSSRVLPTMSSSWAEPPREEMSLCTLSLFSPSFASLYSTRCLWRTARLGTVSSATGTSADGESAHNDRILGLGSAIIISDLEEVLEGAKDLR